MRYISMLMLFCGSVTSLFAGWSSAPVQITGVQTVGGSVSIAGIPFTRSDYILTTSINSLNHAPYYYLVNPNGLYQQGILAAGPCNNFVYALFGSAPTNQLTLITFSKPFNTTYNTPMFVNYQNATFSTAAPIYSGYATASPSSPIWTSFDSSTSTFLATWLDGHTLPPSAYYSTSNDAVHWSLPSAVPGLDSIDTPLGPNVTSASDNNGRFIVCVTAASGGNAYYVLLGEFTYYNIPTNHDSGQWVVPAWHEGSGFIVTWPGQTSPYYPYYAILGPTGFSLPAPITTSFGANPSYPVSASVDPSSHDVLFVWADNNGKIYSATYDVLEPAVSVQDQVTSQPPMGGNVAPNTWVVSSVNSTDQLYVIQGTGPFSPSTTTTVNSSPNPSIRTQNITIKAVVSPADATGRVIFRINGKKIGSAALFNGVARFTTCTLSRGRNTITATYLGNGQFTGSSGTTIQVVR